MIGTTLPQPMVEAPRRFMWMVWKWQLHPKLALSPLRTTNWLLVIPTHSVTQTVQIWMMCFYSVALSDAEVSALYNDGASDIGEPKFAITSPSTIKASVGRSISYQITTDTAYGMTGYNSTIAYEILNAPSWLSVDSGSGSVTGTPPLLGLTHFR